MRVVIFAESDFEPITAVMLGPSAIHHLRNNETLQLAVMMPPMLEPWNAGVVPDFRMRTVRLRPVWIRNPHWPQDNFVLVTHDEQSAMLLKSEFLPGQQAELSRRQESAFVRGFFKCLAELG